MELRNEIMQKLKEHGKIPRHENNLSYLIYAILDKIESQENIKIRYGIIKPYSEFTCERRRWKNDELCRCVYLHSPHYPTPITLCTVHDVDIFEYALEYIFPNYNISHRVLEEDTMIYRKYLIPINTVNFKQPIYAEYYESGRFTDCTVNGIRAHRLFLAGESEFFKTAYIYSDEVNLNFESRIVKLALDLLYCQNNDVLDSSTLDETIELFYLVHMYFPTLVDAVANELTRFKDREYLPDFLKIYNHEHLKKFMKAQL